MMMLITKPYTDLTYWKKTTYDDLATYDSDDNESVVYDSASELHLDNSKSLQLSFSSDQSESIVILDGSTRKDDDHDVSASDDSDVITICKRKRKPKRRKGGNQFILDECEDAYDDEECFLDDEATQAVDQSLLDFIDDDEEVEEEGTTDDEVDNEPNYIKSVSHLVGVPSINKFKLKYDPNPNMDVFSQMPLADEEENEYEMDSFCCDDIIYSATQPAPDLKSPSPNLRLRSKRRVMRKSSKASTPKQGQTKRFRRVIIESP